MMRGGFISLIVYGIYTIFWGGISLCLGCWAVQEGNLGLVAVVGIVMALTFVLAIGGLLAVILKLIHIGTRWKLFGILCILIDGYVLYTLIPAFLAVGTLNIVSLVLLLSTALSVVSLFDNLRSLSF